MPTSSQQKVLFVQSKQGELVIGARDVPKPGPTDILVKNEAVGLNPVDWKIITFGMAETYPTILGHDAAGVVEAVGESVTAFAKGDRVLYQGFSEDDRACFQQYTLIDGGLAAKLPESLSFEQGATLPLAFATAAIGFYFKAGGPLLTPPWAEGGRGKYKDTPLVVIGGASTAGSLALQFAKLSGFSPIITTASARNTALLQSYGATHVLDRNLSADALKAEVQKIAGGPVTLVYDAVSVPETQAAGYGLLAPAGKLLTLLPPKIAETSDGRTVVQVSGVVQFPMNVEFGKALFLVLSTLLETGDMKPLRFEVVPGGLEGVAAGLDRLKNNQVSAAKLVVSLA
ncbi:GroES-like protein [Lentinus brumalis]|uniref:GroES-like protein n=1 Tax=Lentinus brumalis TaxID=2498619 RepID=A0A371DWP4_9APHY|nr:GroES-like protein [Polyporus brumalis]